MSKSKAKAAKAAKTKAGKKDGQQGSRGLSPHLGASGVTAVTEIPIQHIKPSATNPRKVFAVEALDELAASIQLHGVMQPILVRPLQGSRGLSPHLGKFELVAGERRWRAAKAAKLTAIPAIVRELDDAQAMELQQIENLQRVDLTILEEADGYAALIATGNYTPESLGEKLGKSRATIYERLKLAKVSEPVRKAIEKGELPASQAALIASVPGEAAQKALLEESWDSYTEAPASVRDLKHIIEREYTRNLNKAPFDLKPVYGKNSGCLNVDVAACGSCMDCPKRSGNIPGAGGSPNTCTDVTCYEAKAAQAAKEILADHAAKGLPVLDEATAKRVFRYGGVDSRAPYYDANDRVHLVDDGDGDEEFEKTWKEVLGKKLPTITLCVNEDGQLKELIDKESAIEALRTTKLKLHELTVRSELAKPKEISKSDRGAAIEEGKIKRLQTEKKAAAILALVRNFNTLQLLGFVLSQMVNDWKFARTFKDKLGIKEDADVEVAPEKFTQELAAYLMQFGEGSVAEMVLRCHMLGSKDQWEAYKVDNFAESLGLPVEEIEAAATKEFKDAKAEKAAGKTKKKGTQTHE